MVTSPSFCRLLHTLIHKANYIINTLIILGDPRRCEERASQSVREPIDERGHCPRVCFYALAHDKISGILGSPGTQQLAFVAVGVGCADLLCRLSSNKREDTAGKPSELTPIVFRLWLDGQETSRERPQIKVRRTGRI